MSNDLKIDGGKVIHVSWTEEGAKLSKEEKTAFIQKVINDHLAEKANTVPIPVSTVLRAIEAFRKLDQLTTFNVNEMDYGILTGE
jgi:hypothetical protein